MVTTYLDAIRPVRSLADNEVQSHEGGIAFAADRWTRLRRFLILGSEGSFYQSGHDLTVENVGVVKECLADDKYRAILEIVTVSKEGRAPKNEPAILALAMASLDADSVTRRMAFEHLSKVCRTGTHLLHFVAYREALGGGWGRGMRRAIGAWFTEKTPHDLAYQAVKYPSRNGWALADLLRLSHPKMGEEHSRIAKWIVDGDGPSILLNDADAFLDACIAIGVTGEGQEEIAGKLIRKFRMPREVVPTEMLNSAEVWDALLADMPMTAMIRNLGKMSNVGLLTAGSDAERTVMERVTDANRLRMARVHPIAILAALKVYEQGRGERGSLAWTPSKRVVNALDEAFYLAFGAVESTGKRIRLALDVSASMDGAKVNGMPFLTARETSAALALVTAAVEPDAHFVAYSHELVGVNIRPSMRLDDVIRTLQSIPMGGTFCTLPIQQAIDSGADIDAFVSYTDSETWNGGARDRSEWHWQGYHVPGETASEALREYRMRSGINARHAVVAMTANQFSIADSSDPGQLDVAGFDSATPQILSDFVAGMV